jgi:predicted RNA-binding Zn ribbon-like protein
MSADGKPVSFYFRAGNLALDFVNTVGNRLSETEVRDYFERPEELLRWVKEAGLSLPGTNGKESMAPRDLRKGTAFRESLYRLFLKQIEGKPALPEDLRHLNDILSKQRLRMHLTRQSGIYQWRSESTSNIEWLLEQVAESAATLITSPGLEQLRVCEDENCGWFFLDRSRNLPRRWCSMEDCGNRAKARRHYERIKQS